LSFAFSSRSVFDAAQRCLIGRIVLIAALIAVVPLSNPARGDDAPAQIPGFRVVFEGNPTLSIRVLRKAAAEELDSYERNGYRQSDIDDAAFQMTVAYRKKGYAFAEVDYQIDAKARPVVVTFKVSEGPQVVIEGITFSGNKAFDGDTLDRFFNGQPKRLIGKGRLLFQESEIETARSKIRAYYLSNGFLDVDIPEPKVSFSKDRSSAAIAVVISEGVQYVIRAVAVTGDRVPEATAVIEAIGRELVDQPYIRRKNMILRSRLLNAYKDLGYAFASIDVSERSELSTGDVFLEARVDSGPVVTIARIDVRGNQDIRESFIRNRLRLKPGDRYSTKKERESFRSLYRTGLFTNVDLRLEPLDSGAQALLVVEVVEAASLEFYVEPGWGSYEKLRLIAGFRERSLFGTGIILNPEAKVSVKAQSLTVRVTDPWFLNTEVTADFPVYYNHRQEPSFTRRDLGFGASFSRALSESWRVSTGYNLRQTDLSDVAPDVQDTSQQDNYNLGSVQAQGTHDTRNDLFSPTRGRRFFLAAEYADPVLGGDITFLRLTGGVRQFYRLFRETVLGIRYKTGFIIPGGAAVGLPISERFFNGGENTVRSYKESELGPKDLFGEPVGGYGYNVFNLEIRQRLYKNFIGTVFVDVGNVSPNRSRAELGLLPYASNSEIVSDTQKDFFNDFRPGVGFGLQYLLPIGPLRADLAYNPDFDRERDQDEFVFHFSVGTAF